MNAWEKRTGVNAKGKKNDDFDGDDIGLEVNRIPGGDWGWAYISPKVAGPTPTKSGCYEVELRSVCGGRRLLGAMT